MDSREHGRSFTVDLHQQAYTFRARHRIMVHVQGSWFPLYDRLRTRIPTDFATASVCATLSSDFRIDTSYGAVIGNPDTLRVRDATMRSRRNSRRSSPQSLGVGRILLLSEDSVAHTLAVAKSVGIRVPSRS